MKQTNPFSLAVPSIRSPQSESSESTVKLIEPFILLAVYYLVMTFAFTV